MLGERAQHRGDPLHEAVEDVAVDRLAQPAHPVLDLGDEHGAQRRERPRTATTIDAVRREAERVRRPPSAVARRVVQGARAPASTAATKSEVPKGSMMAMSSRTARTARMTRTACAVRAGTMG
ncbi:MAG: hypothetical protein A2V77_00910 [Anaeromyxobacter sp. RBG_16_69_14]|nr:MAG: hypothetical protein A2V77_00910 [Anaeromyxobacter sp. RBG_16_69_14]